MSSSSSSGSGGPTFALLNGHAAGTPDVIASFRVGDNSMRPDGVPEFMVREGVGVNASAGHITWDPGYDAGGTGGEFRSVAPVRMYLDVGAGRVKWSVGTTDYISCDCKPFQRIAKVQVLASAVGDLPDYLVRWDDIRVSVLRPGGILQSHTSPCLPRASSRAGVRRASADRVLAAPPCGLRQQYAEILGLSDAVAIELMGQVTLHARGEAARPQLLSPDSLGGQVLVFAE